MKKILLLTLGFIIMFATANYAAVTTYANNTSQAITVKPTKGLWNKARTTVTKKITEVKKIVKALKTNYRGTLRTALILMLVGVIFLILAGVLNDHGIVWAVGAVFFLIGAVFLLLYLI